MDRDALLALRAQIDQQLASTPAERAQSGTPTFMTPTEFAEHLGIAESTVRRMLGDGLPHVRPRPRLIRIKLAEAEVWMQAREKAPRSARVDAHKGVLQ